MVIDASLDKKQTVARHMEPAAVGGKAEISSKRLSLFTYDGVFDILAPTGASMDATPTPFPRSRAQTLSLLFIRAVVAPSLHLTVALFPATPPYRRFFTASARVRPSFLGTFARGRLPRLVAIFSPLPAAFFLALLLGIRLSDVQSGTPIRHAVT